MSIIVLSLQSASRCSMQSRVIKGPALITRQVNDRVGSSNIVKEFKCPPPRTSTQVADDALKSFNSWAFKREQPDNPGRLKEFITASVHSELPISFALYWGRGPRAAIATPDFQCMDFLRNLADRVKAAYRHGAAITLILTDTHARLNGYGSAETHKYFNEVAAAAHSRGFQTRLLGDVVSAASGLIEGENVTGTVCPDTLASLEACARKWYGGEGSAEDGAIRYFQANMIEKRAVEIAYPSSIFITFNGSNFRELFPAGLPIFYMYSLRKGVGLKPWFIDQETEQSWKETDSLRASA